MEEVSIAETKEKLFGRAIKRAEDIRYITGKAHYVEDIHVENCLWGYFVRSPFAHAKLLSVNVERAMKLQGVAAVLKADDLKGKVGMMPTLREDKRAKPTTRPVVAELVEVNYQPLEAVSDPEKAIQKGSVAAHEDVPDNIGYYYSFETAGFSN